MNHTGASDPMKLHKDDWKGLLQELESLRSELKTLHERMASLEEKSDTAAFEATAAAQAALAPTPVPLPKPLPVALNDDVVMILSAAIAAFLGKKPHIRQIRLLGSAAWAQQGRVTVQASHRL